MWRAPTVKLLFHRHVIWLHNYCLLDLSTKMETLLMELDSIALIEVIKGFCGTFLEERLQGQVQDDYFTWEMRNTLRCKHIMCTLKYPEVVIATVWKQYALKSIVI